jgi:agmatine deiminase
MTPSTRVSPRPRVPASPSSSPTPSSLGYTFPPEWHPQAATWFSWPRPEGISFPAKYHTVPENIARIMHAIMLHGQQKVRINVPNENYEHIVRQHLADARVPAALVKRFVEFFYFPTNEAWCRDHGPAFLIRKPGARGRAGKPLPRRAVVDWGFNAWGGKYPPWDADDSVPQRVAERFKLPLFSPAHPAAGGSPLPDQPRLKRVVMEGGAVEFNGAGTVLTTTSCLLNKNRNPNLSKDQIEQLLKDYYGQQHVCWLGEGIVGDDTDGHIDDLARFLDPHTLAIAIEPDRKDANHDILEDNRRRAKKLRDQHGKHFSIVELPMPGVVEHDGQRLPATYLNFLFVNNALLVPTFRNKRRDREALEILQRYLPQHRVVGIDCSELIWGLGAIHCLTQQEPR